MALHRSDGDLLAAVADMSICGRMDGSWVRACVLPHLASAPIVVADANLPPDGLRTLAEACSSLGVPFFFEPVSVPKADAAVRAGVLRGCTFVSPNEEELLAMARALGQTGQNLLPVPTAVSEAHERALEAAATLLLAHGPRTLLVTRGAAGVLLASRDGASSAVLPGGVRFLRFAAHPVKVRSTRGAGDSFVAGFVGAWLRGLGEDACMHAALAAAAATLESDAAVSQALSPALFL
ncbi:Ribokinase-like protein [Pavlovales sp. CCMP2436]|nr:Ribokinase-like protein [Pavlovales sp. CCMP2436]